MDDTTETNETTQAAAEASEQGAVTAAAAPPKPARARSSTRKAAALTEASAKPKRVYNRAPKPIDHVAEMSAQITRAQTIGAKLQQAGLLIGIPPTATPDQIGATLLKAQLDRLEAYVQ